VSFPLGHAEAIVFAVLGSFDVARLDLWYLEGSQADVAAELNDEIVAMGFCVAAEFLELAVSHPDFVDVGALGGFETHYQFII